MKIKDRIYPLTRRIVMWIVVVGLLVACFGIYREYIDDHRIQADSMRKETLGLTRQVLHMQGQLDRNGKIAGELLIKVDDMAKSIHLHQKESRAMFMAEFGKLLCKDQEILGLIFVNQQKFAENWVKVLHQLEDLKKTSCK